MSNFLQLSLNFYRIYRGLKWREVCYALPLLYTQAIRHLFWYYMDGGGIMEHFYLHLPLCQMHSVLECCSQQLCPCSKCETNSDAYFTLLRLLSFMCLLLQGCAVCMSNHPLISAQNKKFIRTRQAREGSGARSLIPD